MKKVLSLLLLLAASDAGAQMPVELVNAERAKILQGVKSVPKLGAPGPVGIWGQIAFPILSAADKDGIEIAVGAAAAHGKGRIICSATTPISAATAAAIMPGFWKTA